MGYCKGAGDHWGQSWIPKVTKGDQDSGMWHQVQVKNGRDSTSTKTEV